MNYGIFQWINDLAGRYSLLDKGMIFITDSVPYIVIVFMLFLWFTANKEKGQKNNIQLLHCLYMFTWIGSKRTHSPIQL